MMPLPDHAPCALVTTTWNSVDHLVTFLRHYRALGIDHMMVMDFDSTDGTPDILNSREWQGFVEVMPFPGLENLDSSNTMLSIAKQRYPGARCLFCDPDELLVTPAMSISDPALAAVCAAADIVSIPRFNLTAPLSVASTADHKVSATDALTLRIDGRHVRQITQDIEADTMVPPWIFTAIPGKVLVRLDAAISIGDGDHVAHAERDEAAAAPGGVYLLHSPFRSYLAFRNKIEMARTFYASNPQLAPHFGWQLRRWIRMAQSRRLLQEYLQQFIADEKIGELIADGTLARDESVARFHQQLA